MQLCDISSRSILLGANTLDTAYSIVPGHVQIKASTQAKDLLNRLNNAVKQRNDAREEALLASQVIRRTNCAKAPGRTPCVQSSLHLVPSIHGLPVCVAKITPVFGLQSLKKLEEAVESGAVQRTEESAAHSPADSSAGPSATSEHFELRVLCDTIVLCDTACRDHSCRIAVKQYKHYFRCKCKSTLGRLRTHPARSYHLVCKSS